MTPAQKAHAAWLWSRRQATVVGVSAAAVHNAKWIDSRLPAELNQASQHKTRDIVLHNDTLPRDEIEIVRGIPVTTAARTAFDHGRRYGRTLAVIRVDALLQATALKLADIETLIDRHRGARGIAQLREVVRLAATNTDRRLQPLWRSRPSHRYGLAPMEGRCGVRRRTTLDEPDNPRQGNRPASRTRGNGLAHHSRQRRDAEVSTPHHCRAHTRGVACSSSKLKLCRRKERICLHKFSFGYKNLRRRVRLRRPEPPRTPGARPCGRGTCPCAARAAPRSPAA